MNEEEPRSYDHLKEHQWKPGQSGHPGRKLGSKNRSTIARKWLDAKQTFINPITNETETLTQEDIITLSMIKEARAGNVQAQRALLDSAYGAPKQETEHTVHQQVDVKDMLASAFDDTPKIEE